MSKLSDAVYEALKQLFPEIKIKKEEFVPYKGQKLYLDFYIPQLDLIIEVHGRQHEQFVKHFHGTRYGFNQSRRRDALKHEWAAENGLLLLPIYERDFPITPEKLLALIQEVQKSYE